MTERDASSTALGVTGLRAAHLLIDDPPPILDDPIALRLLDPGAEAAIRDQVERFRTPGSLGLRSHVLLRNRWAEDRLEAAVIRGCRQYLLLGAGLDTFAYRQPAWAHDVAIFEVDHPASQRAKLTRLVAAGVEVPPNVHHVAADLASDELLPDLRRAGFRVEMPAFVSCLGVLPYLEPATVEGTFRFVGGLASGSEFVLSFAQPRRPGWPDTLATLVAAAGEPFLTRATPVEIEAELRDAGLTDVSFLRPEEAQSYFAGRVDGLRASERTSIARAVVPGCP